MNKFLFVTGVEISKFKAKGSETNASPLCLGYVSKNFSADSMNKTGLFGYVYDFDSIVDSIVVLDIHKYLMEKHDSK